MNEGKSWAEYAADIIASFPSSLDHDIVVRLTVALLGGPRLPVDPAASWR